MLTLSGAGPNASLTAVQRAAPVHLGALASRGQRTGRMVSWAWTAGPCPSVRGQAGSGHGEHPARPSSRMGPVLGMSPRCPGVREPEMASVRCPHPRLPGAIGACPERLAAKERKRRCLCNSLRAWGLSPAPSWRHVTCPRPPGAVGPAHWLVHLRGVLGDSHGGTTDFSSAEWPSAGGLWLPLPNHLLNQSGVVIYQIHRIPARKTGWK